MNDATLLIIDDDEDILLSARMYLKNKVREVITCKSAREINVLISKHEPDIILLDMNYQKGASDGREGMYWLEHILSVDRDLVVVLMTAYGNVELAVSAIKNGATDFILKPWENEKLFATLSSAYKLRQSNKKLKKLEKINASIQNDRAQSFGQMIGHSPAIIELQRMISKVGPTEANILILGENGTGKQVVAHEIHKHSLRRTKIFMHVDLGALHDNLFESELFGHAKGAFTDAKEDKPGRFELADGGTIFLDEIGNLSVALQSKLLHVIQNRTVIRVGESKERKIDVRIIAATNRNLNKMVSEGDFREDLLFRINTVEFYLPPLRERGNDISELAAHYLHVFRNKYQKRISDIHESALNALAAYSWPGNIRELQHVVERAVIMAEQPVLLPHDFHLRSASGSVFPTSQTLPLGEMEKQMVEKAINKHKGNISRAAAELGLTRAALYRRIEKFGI